MQSLTDHPLVLFPVAFVAMWLASAFGLWLRDRRADGSDKRSEDFGIVVTQAPVARFARTPAVAGDTPRIFGTSQPDGWTGTT